MEEAIIAFLLKEILAPETEKVVKMWLLGKLKTLDAAQTNVIAKTVIEAAEAFLTVAA